MAYVQSTGTDAGGAGTGTSIAFATNNVAGNALFFAARFGGDCTVTVSDSRGNTWTEDVHQVQSSDLGLLSVWSAPNCAAGANNITFSLSASVTARYLIAEYDGMLTSSILDKKAVTESAGATSATPTSAATATTTNQNNLILGVVITNGSQGTISAGSGFTLREAASETNRVALEDKLVTSVGGYTSSFNFSGADTYAIAVLAYKMQGPAGLVATLHPNRNTFQSMNWMR